MFVISVFLNPLKHLPQFFSGLPRKLPTNQTAMH